MTFLEPLTIVVCYFVLPLKYLLKTFIVIICWRTAYVGSTPGNDLAVAVHRRWIFPDDVNYRHELIANYDYWAKELFSNSNLQLELLPHLGLATFVKDPFITKKELARATASFVQVIPEDKI